MTMPAGKYYEVWDDVCKLIITDEGKCLEGEFNLPDGRRFAMYNTYWGDGEYYDQKGKAYSVDAGSIGCILESDIYVEDPSNFKDGGQLIDFPYEFDCKNNEGTLIFGHVHINTYQSEDQMEEEEEEEY